MNSRMRGFAVVLVLLFGVAGPAMADHGHWRGHVGVYFGDPFWPWGYYPPYPYYPPVVAVPVPTSPPVYIEREPAQPEESYWYYCENPQGYYPYIKSCPGGWKKVVPTPTPQQ